MRQQTLGIVLLSYILYIYRHPRPLDYNVPSVLHVSLNLSSLIFAAQIIGSYPCVLVEGLDVIECQFAFGEHAFFLMRGMRINTGESLPE